MSRTDRPAVLSVAATDSRAGAGSQADLKTIEALGGRALSAVTAVTAQNAEQILAIHPVPPTVVRRQIDAALGERPVAVKIGLVVEGQAIDAIVEALAPFEGPIVVDPVIRATTGDRLVSDAATPAAWLPLIARATLVTPNAAELAWLGGESGLLAAGAEALLVTDGDGEGAEAVDLRVTARGRRAFAHPRLDASGSHGSGCALASAIATLLARGRDLDTAILEARAFVLESIRHAVVERGGASVDPLFAMRSR